MWGQEMNVSLLAASLVIGCSAGKLEAPELGLSNAQGLAKLLLLLALLGFEVEG